jgi:hypothetical protein
MAVPFLDISTVPDCPVRTTAETGRQAKRTHTKVPLHNRFSAKSAEGT